VPFVLFFGTLNSFSAVNGGLCGMGRGPTFKEAKEDAARRCLKTLRGFFGVKEGVMMREIKRSPNLDANEPPEPPAISIELITESELRKRKKKSSPSFLNVLLNKLTK
jgi:hypothetical protein